MKSKVILSMLTIILSLWLISCDDDKEMAINLSGEWRGDFASYYTSENRQGDERFIYADETYIKFVPDYPFATHGYGIEIDYYDRGQFEYIYHRFDWEVDDEILYLTYRHDGELDAAIDDYRLKVYEFYGHKGGEHFHLDKISDDDFYWDDYYDDYGCRHRR